jgi:nitrogenase molybdenum-iron protein alpha/beta subunit
MNKTEHIKKLFLYQINPIYSILRFDWFIYYLHDFIIKNNKDKKIFVYCIKDLKFHKIRKSYGKIVAIGQQKNFINAIKNIIQDDDILGEFDEGKIFLMSTSNLIRDFLSADNNIMEKYETHIGFTQVNNSNNALTAMNTAEVALSYCLENKTRIKYLDHE